MDYRYLGRSGLRVSELCLGANDMIQKTGGEAAMSVSQIQVAENGPSFSRLAAGLWRLAEWKMSTDESAKLDRCRA